MTTPNLPGKKSNNNNSLSLRLKRRHVLPLAGTATAIGLMGCAMNATAPTASAPSTANPDSRQAAKLVQNYTSDIELALDKVDRERLRAAAEKKTQTIVQMKTSTSTETVTAPSSLDAVLPALPGELVGAAPAAAAVVPPAAVTPAPVAEASVPIFKPAPVKPVVEAAAPEVSKPAPASPVVAAPSASKGAGSAVSTVEPKVAAVTPAAPNPVVTSAAASPSVAKPAVAFEGQSPMAVLVASPLLFPDSTSPTSGLEVSSAIGDAIKPPVSSADIASSTPAASAMAAMTAVAEPPPPPMSDPTAVAAPAPEATVDDALAILRKNVGEHPTLSTALALALLDGKVGGASGGDELIKSLSPADQKVASDLLAALGAMKPGGAEATVTERAAPLLTAAAKWQGDADLSLPRMTLATRVDSFGVFTETPSTFEQGKRHTVIIYCEVANFGSSKDTEWYTTRLSQQESLITEDGLLVWRPNSEDVEDRSRNQRHDFYLVKKLTLPETLAAGKYTLRMTVTDKTKNRTAVVNRPIEIVVK